MGGHVNVPCTSYMKYCYSAEISGIVCYVTCCYVIVYSGIVYCDDAKKPKNAPQVFPGFPIIKSARHCGKITIFKKKCAFYGHGFRSGGIFMYIYIFTCIQIYTYTHTHIHIYTYTYTHIRIYIHIIYIHYITFHCIALHYITLHT